MSGAPTGAWVRVSLINGDSKSREWMVDARSIGARVDVGSGPDCAWSVRAPGIAPRHLEMYWDGEVLWVANAGGTSSVKVDGLVVDDWYATGQGSSIEFGAAAMRVETGASLSMPSDVANRVTTPDEAPPTVVARPGHFPDPSLDGPTDQVMAPPSGENPFHEARTQLMPGRDLPEGLDDAQAAATRIAAFEAQVSSQPPTALVDVSAAIASRPASSGGSPGPRPVAPAATQLVSLPEASEPNRGPPPPRFGAAVARETPAPPPRAAPVPDPVAPPSSTPTPAEPAPTPAGPRSEPFMGPPPVEPKTKRKKDPNAPKPSLPPRTWALLIVTVGALVGVLFMGSGDEEDVPEPPTAQQPSTDPVGDETPGMDRDTDVSSPPAHTGTPEEHVGEADATGPTEVEGQEEEEEEDGMTGARRAADALFAGRLRDAYDSISGARSPSSRAEHLRRDRGRAPAQDPRTVPGRGRSPRSAVRGSRMKMVMLSGLSLAALLVACEDPPPPPTFRVSFTATSDSEPLGGVRVSADGSLIGETNDRGMLRVELTGREGQNLAISADCPEGHREPEQLPVLTLRSFQGLDPAARERGIEMSISCPPTERLAAVVIRALASVSGSADPVPVADLPVIMRGREVARTDAGGVAHLSFRMRPNSTFRLQMDTSARADLRPQSPGNTFTVPDANDVLLYDQPFEMRRRRRPPRRPPPPAPEGPRIPTRLN